MLTVAEAIFTEIKLLETSDPIQKVQHHIPYSTLCGVVTDVKLSLTVGTT
jgi:hypothetical protein